MSKSKLKKSGNNAQAEVRSTGKKARKASTGDRRGGDERRHYADCDTSLPRQAPPRFVRNVEAKNERQADYMQSIFENTITFGAGPAGTGKTYVCMALAIQELEAKRCDQIVITRPVQSVDEDLGFVPGDLDEKFAIHLEPFWDVLYERLGEAKTKYYMEQGRIVAAPLGTMRGRTFKNSWVILDEAQNATAKQMEMFLTRIGEGTKMIINGDLRQIDLERTVISGLRDGMRRMKPIRSVGCVEFRAEDSVRHGMLREIIDAYAE